MEREKSNRVTEIKIQKNKISLYIYNNIYFVCTLIFYTLTNRRSKYSTHMYINVLPCQGSVLDRQSYSSKNIVKLPPCI